MNKKLIRLTENDLHRIVKESVNRLIKESQQFPIDPSDLARGLFDEGIDVAIFVNRLEREYEKLREGSQTNLLGGIPSDEVCSNFDEDTIAKAYKLGGENITVDNYPLPPDKVSYGNSHDLDEFYGDFDKWWKSLPFREQERIYNEL